MAQAGSRSGRRAEELNHALAFEMVVGHAVDDDRCAHVALRLVPPGLGDGELAADPRDLEADGLAAVGAGEERIAVGDGGEEQTEGSGLGD